MVLPRLFPASQASYCDLQQRLFRDPTGLDTPGYVAHTLFGPLTANFLLRLYVYWIAILSLYFAAKRSYGLRCAVICCFLLCACADFLLAAGWDYVDGIGIAYGLLCVEELGASAAASSRRTAALRAIFAGLAYAAAVHVQVYLLILGPVLAVVFLARTGKRGLLLVLPALAGFVALTISLGLVNVALGGSFLFFTPSLSTGVSALKSDPYYLDPWLWTAGAWWLVIPCALGLASLLFAIQMATQIGSGDGPRAIRIARMADASLCRCYSWFASGSPLYISRPFSFHSMRVTCWSSLPCRRQH